MPKELETWKEYLGDSVYVEIDPYGALVLTTDNGLGPSNRIVFEPEVLLAFERYVANARARVSDWKKDNKS